MNNRDSSGKKYNLKDYWRILRSRGVLFYWEYFRQNVLFDIVKGTDTYKRQSQEEYDVKPGDFAHGIWYVGIKTSILNLIFKDMGRVIGHDNLINYQFVDLGCGKGKSILCYIDQHSAVISYKAIGVEYSDNLVKIARQNLKKLKMEEYGVIINDDARNFYRYTSNKKLIIYMYNPFSWVVMKGVFDSIVKYEEIYIFYVDPVEHLQIIKVGFNHIKSYIGKYPSDNYNIYHYSI